LTLAWIKIVLENSSLLFFRLWSLLSTVAKIFFLKYHSDYAMSKVFKDSPLLTGINFSFPTWLLVSQQNSLPGVAFGLGYATALQVFALLKSHYVPYPELTGPSLC
jgi:hypothetical protein